jgi:hypothetical protein
MATCSAEGCGRVEKHPTIVPGDLYVKRFAIYEVMTYNETDDTVLFGTSNDIISAFGKVRRLEIRKEGLYACPYQLLKPAAQVLKLGEEKYSEKSLESLKSYHAQNSKTYEKLGLSDLFQDVEEASTRVYIVPEIQGGQFPELKGKSFNILVPFICITRDMYRDRYRNRFKDPPLPEDEKYFSAIHSKWPVFFVPTRFK